MLTRELVLDRTALLLELHARYFSLSLSLSLLVPSLFWGFIHFLLNTTLHVCFFFFFEHYLSCVWKTILNHIMVCFIV